VGISITATHARQREINEFTILAMAASS